jgi:DNA mismatch repair protein MutL
VARTAERIYQIFGKETLAQLLPVAAESPLERAGLPEPPPWRRDENEPARQPGTLRLSGFYSRPELQKLNRNSIYVFVNKRLIRDRLLLHAVSEAYRNVIPPTSFPVVLLFLEMPAEEVDVNVHPAKTEVRFRQQTLVHDFVRDSLRAALVKARPAAGFLAALDAAPQASPSLMPPSTSPLPGAPDGDPDGSRMATGEAETFHLTPRELPPIPGNLPFASMGALAADFSQQKLGEVAADLLGIPPMTADCSPNQTEPMAYTAAGTVKVEAEQAAANLNHLGSLRPLGQLRESFILATGADGLWIVDQHVAHERILFEKILRDRQVEQVQRQQLLMPLLVDLKPAQMVVFAQIAEELERNGFEAEPFGPQTLAIKAAPVGLEGKELEKTITQVIEQSSEDSGQEAGNEGLMNLRRRIAASIACHSAIKVNTALDPVRMEWLLLELAKTDHPTSCPHGRPIALLYSWREIQRAFHRI